MLHVDKRCCGLKTKVSDIKQGLPRITRTESGGADRLYPRVTIDVLPDNVLLDTFEFYLGKDNPDEIDEFDGHDYDGWQTLVHVCRRWRCIVFASPRSLDLKLYCTRERSANSEMLTIWPALPIVIDAQGIQSKEDVANIGVALRQHDRVCKINYCNMKFDDFMLKEFAVIDEPFPALTSLVLASAYAQNVPVLPDSFLGRSAPHLRLLGLYGIPYPSIGKLLSSATSIVRFALWRVPHSGYIAPETIVPLLSTFSGLESLTLGIRYPRSRIHRASRHPPPLTRVVFPSLTFLELGGEIEYLEDILSQIEAPMLTEIYFSIFNQVVFDTPLLGHFILRSDTFMTSHTACVDFRRDLVGVTLLGQEMADNNKKAIWLNISCKALDWQLSAATQVLNSFVSYIPTLESLEIEIDHRNWQGEIEAIQWRECLHLFASVKKMTLGHEDLVRLVLPVVQELSAETGTEVLPALQDLFLRMYSWQPSSGNSGSIKKAIERFITTRQRYDHPVTVHYRDTKSGGWVYWEVGNRPNALCFPSD